MNTTKDAKQQMDAAFSHIRARSTDSAMDARRAFTSERLEAGDVIGAFELRTLDDDPAFTRLLDSLDEYARASVQSTKRSFVCAVMSLAVGAISATAAVISLLVVFALA